MENESTKSHSNELTRTSSDSTISEAACRRRLQNRINQRSSREWQSYVHRRPWTIIDLENTGRRKALQAAKQGRGQGRRWIIYTDEVNASSVNKVPAVANSTQLVKSLSIHDYSSSLHNGPVRTQCAQYYADLHKMVAEVAANKVQSPELLLPVTQFNVMRAIFENAASMGLTWDILSEDIASLFNIAGPVTLHLPPSLEPSDTQKSIVHHPWIDLIPIPSLRDALLLQADKYDEDQICGDFYGICSSSPEVGIIVWGESWDPSAYEVSERVFNKWIELFKGCPELIRSTNYWRRKRGEKPLRLPNLIDSCVENFTD
ncbi:uncharacterized protein N7477_003457 [Penicillium maclennaniae]|uniref:uncharacterized protein n=1 Tax=Penicillium maclennaniae TaxID=1343394 RepID=UPI002540A6A8|nr:uncharacterized protein N7477_003457 [Penicillium maclennaniae]KAJ5677824.1 hypothetical protein N7477_003457 [Penicillium maclennaniae]